MTLANKQDRRMNDPQASAGLCNVSLERGAISGSGPSFQRASILFVASLGSFIGASLLLASL
jgi:hypothetical protein